MARFTERFSKGAPNKATVEIEREIMGLLEPAAQRAAIDLYLLCHKRPGQHRIDRDDFYEVTFVQFLYQYMLMSNALAGLELLWEVPYKPTGGRGHPLQVDLEVRRPPEGTDGEAPSWQRMLIELGSFGTAKLKADSEKLRDLKHRGEAITGEKRVILYWLGSGAPKNAGESRDLIRRRQNYAQNVARMGPGRVRPLSVSGFELFTPAVSTGKQFTAVMFEVVP